LGRRYVNNGESCPPNYIWNSNKEELKTFP
jgi:hypothetical protein